MDEALARVRAGEEDPPCLVCGGILKSATVLFGQTPEANDVARAQRAAYRADVLLAVGTTLGVWPAASVVPIALEHGARLIIVNAQSTPFDDEADVVLHESISEVLPPIVRGAQDDPDVIYLD
jgi:NAD-dependent deacetylase